jgi:tetratricopeptide (TPR) repeat protein
MWGRTAEDLSRHDLSGRKLVWLSALHMAARAPLVGNGLGSFYYDYIPEQGKVLKGFPQKDSMQAKETVLWAHDEFLQEAAECGGLGLLLLAILLGGSWWTAIRLPSNRPAGAALAASLAAWSTMALVDFPLHRPAETLLLFVVLGLVGRQREVFAQEDAAGRAIPARLLAGASLAAFLVALIVTGGQFLARGTLRSALEANAAGEPARARILFLRSIHEAPNPGQELASYGAFLCKQGNTREGLRTLRKALASFRDTNLYENLGSAYAQAGETRKAVTMYRLAAGAGIHYLLDSMVAAKLEWSLGGERKAMAELDALHRAAPRNIAVALFLGGRYLDAGQYDACLATVKPALSKGDPNLANLQAAALLRLGKWPQARRCLTDLLETHPHYAPAWTNLGVLDLLEGRRDGAAEDFRRALGREPDSKVVHFYLGKWDSLPRGLAALGPAEIPLDVPSVPITGYVVTDSTLVPM